MEKFLHGLWEYTVRKFKCNKGFFNWVAKKFTPPKSKSPWEAMTAGSTGGWAAPLQSWGPGITAAAGAIPGIGPGISAALGAVGAAGKGTGFQGTDAGWSNLWKTPLGAAQGYGLGSIGAGVKGGISGMSGGTGFLEGAKSGMGGYFDTPIIPGVSGSSGSNIAQGIGSMFQPAQQGAGQAAGSGAYGAWGTAGGTLPGQYGGGQLLPNYAQQFGQATAGLPGVAGGVGSGIGAGVSQAAGQAAGQGINWGQTALGLGASAIPAMMGGETSQIPQSQMYGEMTSKLLGDKAMTEIGQMGRDKLAGRLGDEFSPVPDQFYEASTRRLDEAYDKAERDFATQWQGMRPGSNIESDSAYRKGISEIRERRAKEKSALAAELDYRRETDYMDRQYQDIQQAIGVDSQTMQNYMSLAQMDANQLALNTGITLGEAQQFKDIFGQLGGYLMQRGLGLGDPMQSLQMLMSR